MVAVWHLCLLVKCTGSMLLEGYLKYYPGRFVQRVLLMWW